MQKRKKTQKLVDDAQKELDQALQRGDEEEVERCRQVLEEMEERYQNDLLTRQKEVLTQDEQGVFQEMTRDLERMEYESKNAYRKAEAARREEESLLSHLNRSKELALQLQSGRKELEVLLLQEDELKDELKKATFSLQEKQDLQQKLQDLQRLVEGKRGEVEEAARSLEASDTESQEYSERASEASQKRIEAEREEKELQVLAARQKQKMVDQQAVVAEVCVRLQEERLEEAYAQIPVLANMQQQIANIEEENEVRADRLLEAQDRLSELLASNGPIVDMMNEEDALKPDSLDLYRQNAMEISALKEEISTLEVTITEAEGERKDLDKNLYREAKSLAKTDDNLRRCMRENKAAKDAASLAEKNQIDAEEIADNFEADVENLDRESISQELLHDGRALILKYKAVFEQLEGFDLSREDHRKQARKEVPQLKEIEQEFKEHAFAMIQARARPEELAEVFERVPNGLRPSAYREEIATVDVLEETMDQISSEKSAKARDESILGSLQEPTSEEEAKELVITKLKQLDALRGQVGGVVGDSKKIQRRLEQLGAEGDAMEEFKNANAFIGMVNFKVLYPVGAVSGAIKAYSAENPEEDPIVQKMQDKKKVQALVSLGKTGANIAKSYLPLLGDAMAIQRFVESVAETAARMFKARYDKKLEAAALKVGDVLAGAMRESVSNELALLKKYGLNAGLSAIALSKTLFALGPGPVIQFAIDTTKMADKVVGELLNWKKAAKIAKMVERANTGDPDAKIELVRNHAQYAKGLLALKAQQGDPFAMMYVKSRGLEESDINASSHDIITHYLMQEGKQSGKYETFPQWFSRRTKTVGKLLSAVDSIFAHPWKKNVMKFHSWRRKKSLQLDLYPDVAIPLDKAEELVSWVIDGDNLLQRMREEEGKQKDLPKLETVLTKKKQEVDAIRQKTFQSLGILSKAENKIASIVEKGGDIPKEIQKQIHALPRLRKEQVSLMEIISKVP